MGCHGSTLLCAAADGGCSEMVSALLEVDCQPEVNVESGIKSWPPLQHAVLGGHDEIARASLMAGVHPNFLDTDRANALKMAMTGGR